MDTLARIAGRPFTTGRGYEPPTPTQGAPNMDPTANLAEMRALAARLLAGAQSPDATEADAVSLAEHLDALDTWITRGGFLPEQWTR